MGWTDLNIVALLSQSYCRGEPTNSTTYNDDFQPNRRRGCMAVTIGVSAVLSRERCHCLVIVCS